MVILICLMFVCVHQILDFWCAEVQHSFLGFFFLVTYGKWRFLLSVILSIYLVNVAMFNHNTAQLWFHTGPILGSCKFRLCPPCVWVPCGLLDSKIAILTMAVACWLCSWASSVRTKPKLFVHIIIIRNYNLTKFDSATSAAEHVWAPRHCWIWWWCGARNAVANKRNPTTLDYFIWPI